MRKISGLLLLSLLLALASCHGSKPDRQRISVLFVGNSLTYVGNSPAVFEALAKANERSASTDMIVSGGATLSQRVADGSVAAALKSKHYAYIVVQERGGDALCSFGPNSCRDFENAVAALAKVASENAAHAVLLGSYQNAPASSAALVHAEGLAAERAAMPYLAVSDLLLKGRTEFPACQWFYSDGMHPGHDLAFLNSVLLYKHIYGELPQAVSLTVNAPMYIPKTKFDQPSPVSHAIAGEELEQKYFYDTQCTHQIVELAKQLWDTEASRR